ncbi:hypothetical protein MIND_00767200 [Mycena indigotica]|uniref:WSC domain-containing protein n=1 Tax=Mycena indigotica TaxID=2126181 RepID=A0A8H6W1F1_9AGAR|nr:uncharacterized protein MIND_00767200 [Mycena indigotica]KAF7302009.1 hypothetical protein MIND_00767200 [Mycena indigotica]
MHQVFIRVFLVLFAYFATASAHAIVVQRDSDISWTLQGCYTDTSTSRTLGGSSAISDDMTIETCQSFCSEGGFNLAGVELGSQCFCDNGIQATGATADIANCNAACSGDDTEICGGEGFINIYWNGAPQTCLSFNHTTTSNVQAVYVSPPTTGPASVPIYALIIFLARGFAFEILSTGFNAFNFVSLTNGGLKATSATQPSRAVSLSALPGDSPTFVMVTPLPAALPAYCMMPNPFPGQDGTVLAVNGRSDLWALCANTSAAGRVDLVFDPIPNHPRYELANCRSVYLTLTDA